MVGVRAKNALAENEALEEEEEQKGAHRDTV